MLLLLWFSFMMHCRCESKKKKKKLIDSSISFKNVSPGDIKETNFKSGEVSMECGTVS